MPHSKLLLLSTLFFLLTACNQEPSTTLQLAQDYQRIDADWLTFDEAKLRRQTISQVKYSLQIDLTKSARYHGTVEIEFNYQPTKYPLTIDFVDGEAERIFVNRKSIPIDYNGNFINIPSVYLDSGYNKIKIQYSHPYSDNGSGLYRYQDPTDDNVYIYSHFEPYDANRLFPSFDQPDLRATYKLKVVTHKSWTVISSIRESHVIEEGSYKRWTFPESANFSTYIFSLHAGPWHIWEGKAGKTPLRLIARKSLAALVDVREWFRITQQGFKFYEKYFDLAYPYSKYDQLLVPDFNIGGMENVGAVTFTENYIPRGTASWSHKRKIANTILHELSHMWFGDLVTIDWWSSLWLKESFASYMAPLALSKATDYQDAWRAFNSNVKQRAYQADQSVTTHPIDMPVADTKSGDASFDSITYRKGASVLKQLVHFIGEDNFRDGIRSYLKKHKNQAAQSNDFFQALSSITDEKLQNWTSNWINTAGVNTLLADYQCANGLISKFSLIQSAPDKYPILRSHQLQVGIYHRNDQYQIVSTKVLPVRVNSAVTNVRELVGQPCPLLVYPNHDDWGYFKVQLDSKTLLMLPDHIFSVKDPLLRTMFWQSLWDMVLEVKIPVTQYLDLALSNIAAEDDAENLDQVLSNILRTKAWLAGNQPLNSVALQYLADFELLMLNQSQDAKDGSEIQKIWFKYFTKIAQSEQSLNHLSNWLQGYAAPQVLAKDQDRRWNAIIQLSSNGHEDTDALIKLEKLRDSSDKGSMMLLAANASQPDLDIKQYWLDELIRDQERQTAARLKQALIFLFPVGQTQLHQPFAEKIILDLHKIDQHRGQDLVATLVANILPILCSVESVALLMNAQQQMTTLGLIAQKGLMMAHQEDVRCVAINAFAAKQ